MLKPRLRAPASILAASAVIAIVAGCGSSSSSSTPAGSGSSSGSTGGQSTGAQQTATIGYEGLPLEQGPQLAPAGDTTQGGAVDGIQCGATEQLAYHIHAHLAVFVQGLPRSLPAGIGIPHAIVQQTPEGAVVGQGQCFYWLHTHTTDGVLHIESPTSRIYTLGNFFDEWRQSLGPGQVGPARGKVTAFVNGKLWTKNPRDVPLEPHAAIQLDVGTPATPFQPVSFAASQL